MTPHVCSEGWTGRVQADVTTTEQNSPPASSGLTPFHRVLWLRVITRHHVSRDGPTRTEISGCLTGLVLLEEAWTTREQLSGTSLMNMIHAVIINSLLMRHVDLYFMEFHIGSVFYQLLPKLQQLDKICRSIWNYAPIKHITTVGIIMSVIFQASGFLQDSLLSFVILRFGLLVAQKKQFEDTLERICRAIY